MSTLSNNKSQGGKKHHSDEIRYAARSLFLRKQTIPEIEEELNVPRRTLYSWMDRDDWKALLRNESVEEAIQRRLTVLAEKEDKTDRDLNEIDRLIASLSKLGRARQIEINNAKLKAAPVDSDIVQDNRKKIEGAPAVVRSKNRKNKIKNDVSFLTEKDFKQKFHKNYFAYQVELANAKKYRNRDLLKSRQIGASWYLSQESSEDATLTGDNQIFLSATRAQAEVFKTYIVNLYQEHFDIELKGNPMVLNTANGPASLYFLSNNSKSAQSYHGHVIIDEFFWIHKFNELYKVATGMAAHKKWRRTLLSTPSAVTHEAYDLWTGDRYQKRFKRKREEFPGFKEMQSGVLCPDNHWRKIITLDDAEAGGCDLFDKEELKIEYSPEEFRQLFMCEFMDDTMGVFRLADLQACGIDTDIWEDYDPKADRPLGNLPVYGGYDPSRHRDDASFVIIAAPLKPGGKFRLVQKLHWKDKSFTWQADQIRQLTKRFNFQHIGVDTTGPGLGVFDIIKNFFPLAQPIHYSVNSKTALVQKAKSVIEPGRLEYPAEWTDFVHAFLTIRQTSTSNGGMTYSAGRTNSTGHADVAWATMHALIHEPMDTSRQSCSSVAFG
ncbi:terminase large subunit domain-containing protein [Endozoicomonas lisbonensis]|uniref:Uncharacterized protein YjcR n=1 Tax=Endozoicomonas lisbonensis TaxID=3120522 RepID=A0ABV2SIE6_9GAMM